MKKMTNRRDAKTLIILLVLSVLFLVLAISFRVRVYESKTYTKRNDIAMYIIKYRHLPSNYILKEDNPYTTTVNALENGYAFGGDMFRYEGYITEYTKNKDLKEADYYPDLDATIASGKRGKYRFVYTNSGKFEIYYSENHYGQSPNYDGEPAFIKITAFKINIFSNIMWICFVQTFSGSLALIIVFQIKSNRKEDLINEKRNN